MTRSRVVVFAAVLCIAALSGADTLADSKARVVTVAFGPGLNTAPLAGPSGPENHHIVPNRIEIDAGDVIEFVFAGFHQIRVYQKGVKLSDVRDLLPPECQDNLDIAADCPATGFPFPLLPGDSDGDTQPDLPVYYEGISPIVAPLTVTNNPNTGAPQVVLPARSAAQNRSETVSFPEPGRYLVICAVIPHLNDKMYAWVVVKGRGHGHDDH